MLIDPFRLPRRHFVFGNNGAVAQKLSRLPPANASHLAEPAALHLVAEGFQRQAAEGLFFLRGYRRNDTERHQQTKKRFHERCSLLINSFNSSWVGSEGCAPSRVADSAPTRHAR